MTFYATVDSPVGELLLAGERADRGGIALASLSMPGQKGGASVQEDWVREPGAFGDITEQLRAYFAGELTGFSFESTTRGSAFQQQVWKAVDAIPYGSTTTYGRLAEQIGISRAAVRALGTAIGANPLLLVRPCHRVIGADGTMRGYAAGIERKKYLLSLEGAA